MPEHLLKICVKAYQAKPKVEKALRLRALGQQGCCRACRAAVHMPCTLTSMCQHVTNSSVKSQLERRDIVSCGPEFEVKVASASKMQLCILAQVGCDMHSMQSVSCMAVCPACKYPKQADPGGVGVWGGDPGGSGRQP